jgi:protocatechuate 3,4-dioxygenase alpha subunit
LTGQVLDGDGTPIDSMVEIWQADESGSFVAEPGIYDEVTGQGLRGFGRCATDFEGRYEFFTVKPGAVPTMDGQQQAPHIAMSVFARGMLHRVVTRVYFDDELAANSADPLLLSVGEPPAHARGNEHRWRIPFRRARPG